METTFKQVAHLYMGCLVMIKGEVYRWHSYNVITGDIFCTNIQPKKNVFAANIASVKPILRPLKSITEQEDQVDFKQANGGLFIDQFIYSDGFFWLTKNRFDLFDLIESGQAIDATTLSPNPYAQ
jgi:hypothetical protein